MAKTKNGDIERGVRYNERKVNIRIDKAGKSSFGGKRTG